MQSTEDICKEVTSVAGPVIDGIIKHMDSHLKSLVINKIVKAVTIANNQYLPVGETL